MSTLFYDHLIDWKQLTTTLDELGIDGDERIEVLEQIEHLIHSEVMIVFVTYLPAVRHHEFIERFHAAPYDSAHLDFVNTHSGTQIEVIVRQRASKVIQEILAELTDDSDDGDGIDPENDASTQ
jgi:hypothetical protein